MLPVSGAEQLNTSGAIVERPMISHSGAYSRLVKPGAVFALRQEQIPQPGGARLWLQFFDHRDRLPAIRPVGVLVIARLIRVDVLLHEGGQPLLEFLYSFR